MSSDESRAMMRHVMHACYDTLRMEKPDVGTATKVDRVGGGKAY